MQSECRADEVEQDAAATRRARIRTIGPASGKVVDAKFQRSDLGRSNTDFAGLDFDAAIASVGTQEPMVRRLFPGGGSLERTRLSLNSLLSRENTGNFIGSGLGLPNL